jgi:fructose-bisphosphate aldolase, class II
LIVAPKFCFSLKELRKTFQGEVPICLHGTDELPDSLFVECIKNGVSKVRILLSNSHSLYRSHCQINVNSWARDPYVKKLTDGLQTMPFPDAVEEATEAFAKVCERFFILFGSSGRA